jgi:hypothetical protein
VNVVTYLSFALLAALAAALDLVELRYSSSAIRGASRLKVQ